MYNPVMFGKLVGTLVMIMGLMAALVVQARAVNAESGNAPVTVPVTAPVTVGIRVTGLVLYKYWGQVRPAVGASVVVRDARGNLVTIVKTNALGAYEVSASGRAYFVFRVNDSFGTSFIPAEKWFKNGTQQSNVDFVGKKAL